jgi:hypothetical protein
MGLLSGNSCNIITLFPLGVECNAINSSTPESSNGVVTLFVTGGTPPYNITWSNGGQGNLLDRENIRQQLWITMVTLVLPQLVR